MAKIRIVDEWLRSPVSAPSRHRSIMVVSSSWSEQRVLMRAFAGSADQTRPTIVLHGVELAIGPAGTDPHSEWGIHVEPPIDGRAQQLREALEVAAKRLAGSKGNPPRLVDEVPNFEKKATNMWAPGTPRATPSAEHTRVPAFEPSASSPGAKTITPATPPPPAPAPPRVAPPDRATVMGDSRAVPFSSPNASHAAAKGGGFRSTPAPITRSELEKKHGALPSIPASSTSSKSSGGFPAVGKPRRRKSKSTRTGFESGAGTLARPATSGGGGTGSGSSKGKSLAQVVGHTMPLGFTLDDLERKVLNALGRAASLTATEVGTIVGVGNGIAWMEALMSKLSEHGLDLIEPGDDRGGEPTYLLRS